MADRRNRGGGAAQRLTYTINRRHRHWEVRDSVGDLVCLTVYKCGAQEVVRRLALTAVAELGPTAARW